MSEDRVTIHIESGVADVRFNRPEKMNALDPAQFDAILAAGERLKTEKGLRAVVLSGEGRAFCAGLDASNFGKMAEGSRAAGESSTGGSLTERSHGDSNRAQYTAMVWRDVPVPVIAAVHGVAFGGGFQIMLGADIRYTAPDTKLSIMEAKWGLVPDMAGFPLMRHLAREDVIRELTYTARIFTGVEAYEYGFATRVCDDPRAEAFKLAREIADKNPDAIRANKRIFKLAALGSVREVLQAESDEQVKLIGSPNQVEAVLSNLQKRAATYRD
jgi:enoyl-CoA hydratase/carnithine racemase